MIGGKPHWKRLGLIDCAQLNRESAADVLAEVQQAQPTAVLTVYEADGQIRWRASAGMTKLKTMGALQAAIIEAWGPVE